MDQKLRITPLRFARLLSLCACLPPAILVSANAALHYSFDDGTFQGWTDLSQPNPGIGPSQWAISPPAFPGNSQNGAGAVGFNIYGGTQDESHPTLWLRSPEFKLDATGDLSVYLRGGTGSGSLAGQSTASVPATSTSPGFQGIALRNANTGIFALSASKPSNGDSWLQVGFTAAQLAALDQNATYTLDLIDAGNGGWGWVAMDTVSIPGALPGAPSISDVPNLTIPQGSSTDALPVTIGDDTTPAASLVLTGASANPTLIPNANIVFGGSGANRTVTLTPVPSQSGSSLITLTVSDGVLSASDTFVITVTSTNSLKAADHFLTGFDPSAGQYSPGGLVGQNPTLTGWSAPWNNGAASGQTYELGLTYEGLATEGGKGSTDILDHGTRIGHILDIPFTGATTGTFYMAALLMLRLDDAARYRALELHDGGYDDGANRKLQLGQNSGDFGANGWALRVGGQTAVLGDSTKAGASANLFVFKFMFSQANNGDSVTLWRNPPSLGDAEPAGGTTLTGFNLAFDRISFASWLNAFWEAPENGAIYFDEIRIGTRWADVTPAGGQPQTGGDFLAYDFEGSLEGWINIMSNTDYSPQAFEASAGGDAQTGAASCKQRLADNWPGFADLAHQTLWVRSPAFRLNGKGDLTFWIFGGGTNANAAAPANESQVPANSVDTVNGGFHGVVLRKVATGEFVLVGNKNTDDTLWEQVAFTQAELAGLDQDAVYTLDAIDARNNAWGWFNFDTVRIPGALVETAPPPRLAVENWIGGQIRISWPAAATGFTLQRSTSVSSGYTSAGLTVAVEGADNVAYDTIATGARFYRLIK